MFFKIFCQEHGSEWNGIRIAQNYVGAGSIGAGAGSIGAGAGARTIGAGASIAGTFDHNDNKGKYLSLSQRRNVHCTARVVYFIWI